MTWPSGGKTSDRVSIAAFRDRSSSVRRKDADVPPVGHLDGSTPGEPAVWLHDVLRSDGRPFDLREAAYLQSIGNSAH
jgi:hypothetical protein